MQQRENIINIKIEIKFSIQEFVKCEFNELFNDGKFISPSIINNVKRHETIKTRKSKQNFLSFNLIVHFFMCRNNKVV